MMPSGVDDRWVRDDEALLAELRSALRDLPAEPRADPWIDDVGTDGSELDPETIERMYAAASAAFTWRTIDEELELLATVELSESDLALVRGAEDPVTRTLEFTGRTIGLELEIGPELIVGQIYPVQEGALTLLTRAGDSTEFTSDEVGGFTFARPDGPFRLRCTTDDAGVITDWICMT